MDSQEFGNPFCKKGEKIMPWCPKCKNEYKEGYTICADCGTELIASLEEGPVAIYFGTEEELQEMCNFMRANGIGETQIKYDEKEGTYELLVARKKATEAQKQLRVYLTKIVAPKKIAEMQCMAKEMEAVSKKEEMEEYNGPYQEADKKAEEYKSGADTLLIVGAAGIIALVLLNLGIIPISLTGFTKALITGVMGVMFVIFIITGISSRKSYKALKEQAGTEKDQKAEIQTYLKENIELESFDIDLIDDEPAMEILYFRRIEKMKEMIRSVYPSIDTAFMDYIIEETYPEIFES